MREVSFVIRLNPKSKKNSMQVVTRDKHGRTLEHPKLLQSKEYRDYERNAMWYVPGCRQIDYPVTVKCIFYRKTKHTVDLVNLLNAIDDILVKSGLIKDDSYKYIASHDGSRVYFDKANPRTEVYITPFEEENKQYE